MNILQPMPATIYGQTTPPGSVLRPRRTRISPALRRMVRETTLSPADFIYPLFVRHGRGERRPIASMPGQFQLSVDELAGEAESILELGIPAVILFGIPAQKDWCGSDNFNPHGVVPEAVRALKAAAPELIVISDMCFCEYTDHGHCGLINSPSSDSYNAALPQGYLLNDPTLELIGRASVVHAEAGADVIAPSAMLDHMVAAIRGALDEAAAGACAHLKLRGQVCQQLLRPLPRRSRKPALLRRPKPVSDGSGQPPRGAEGGRARCGRGGRYDHGQTGAALSGCSGSGAATVQSAHGGLPGQRGVCDAPCRRGQWLARPAKVRPGKPDQHQTRRRRHDPDLLCQGRGALVVRMKGRQMRLASRCVAYCRVLPRKLDRGSRAAGLDEAQRVFLPGASQDGGTSDREHRVTRAPFNRNTLQYQLN